MSKPIILNTNNKSMIPSWELERKLSFQKCFRVAYTVENNLQPNKFIYDTN